MGTRETLGLLGTALSLLVAAWLTKGLQLWSYLGSYTVPWFCVALAVALLIVTLTALLTGCAVGRVPLLQVLVVGIGASVVLGAGMAVDGLCYGFHCDWFGSLGEWFGFTAMLAVLFWVPRLEQKSTGK